MPRRDERVWSKAVSLKSSLTVRATPEDRAATQHLIFVMSHTGTLLDLRAALSVDHTVMDHDRDVQSLVQVKPNPGRAKHCA
jgi:hypothetical protein